MQFDIAHLNTNIIEDKKKRDNIPHNHSIKKDYNSFAFKRPVQYAGWKNCLYENINNKFSNKKI